jgi:hypothetical protein
MPPRRIARAAAAAEHATLSPLPLVIVLHIFSLLPVDARACAACVCRGWCAVLSERSLWTRLDLSPSSGVRVRVTDAVLAGAAAKARGQLSALDVTDCLHVASAALLAVLRANGGALRQLVAGRRKYSTTPQTFVFSAEHVEQALQAAPQLAVCRTDVLLIRTASVDIARRMLRNEPPFQPLRLRELNLAFPRNGDNADEASVLGLAADMGAHASLQRVTLVNAPLRTLAALDAVVDVALACLLLALELQGVPLSPASAPALARLLSSAALTHLVIEGEIDSQLLDGSSALGDALRGNNTSHRCRCRVSVYGATQTLQLPSSARSRATSACACSSLL